MKPVSKTAYYCCGVRAADAADSRPICGDTLAARFMTPDAWALFEPFRRLRLPNISNVVRARIIDDILRDRLASRPETTVIIIGAGFDTRAFRLRGGRWVELDEPAVIAVKQAQLPEEEAPNPLTRIPIAFDTEPLDMALAPFSGFQRPLIVLEGVLLYLTTEQIRTVMETLQQSFRRPTLVCDVMTRAFQRRYAGRARKQLRALGADLVQHDREVLDVIRETGFRLIARDSIAERAVTLGAARIPRWLLATLLRILRDGNIVATFEGTERPTASPIAN